MQWTPVPKDGVGMSTIYGEWNEEGPITSATTHREVDLTTAEELTDAMKWVRIKRHQAMTQVMYNLQSIHQLRYITNFSIR
jgi:hypothetical protein